MSAPTPKHACGKKSYHTRIDALIALSKLDAKRRPREETRLYTCPVCSRVNHEVFHLTSQPFDPERAGTDDATNYLQALV